MIIVLGLFSLLQLMVLPGLFVIRFVQFKNFWIKLLVIFGISPIFNYLLVFLLTAIGWYTQKGILLVFTVECIALLILYFPVLVLPIKIHVTNGMNSVSQFFIEYLETDNSDSSKRITFINVFKIVAFGAAIFAILIYFKLYGLRTSSIFSDWDPVFSWNRWAVHWFENRLPTTTYHYPQLIPANWSLTYQFMGDGRVQFFAKNFAGYLEIFILFAIFTAGIITRNVKYFLGVAITAWLQLRLGSMGSGYVDTPVSFWGILPFLFLLFSKNDKDHWKSYLILGGVFAAGSMVTKQAGGLVVVIYLLLIFIEFWKEKQQEILSIVWKIIGIYVVIIAPWYIYAQYDIIFGSNTSEIAYVTTLGSEGLTWFGTLKSAMGYLVERISVGNISGMTVFIILALIFLFSLKDKDWRYINLFVTIPYFYIWIFYFGYSIRNINLIVPFLGISVGIGLYEIIVSISHSKIVSHDIRRFIGFIFNLLQRLATRLYQLILSIRIIYLLPLLLLIFLFPLRYSDAYMIEKSNALKKQIGTSELNQLIYKYFENHEFEGKILSNYPWIGYMPTLEDHYVAGNSQNAYFITQMNEENISYVLISTQITNRQVLDYIENEQVKGFVEIGFEYEQYMFYHFCHEVCK